MRDRRYFYIPVAECASSRYEGFVYNLTASGGTFLAPYIVTHNCHSFAAGFDLAGPAAVDRTMSLFDELVGLDRLKVVHLNDSKGPLGSNLDRHENIGKGKIGELGFRSFLHHSGITEMPLILETPYSDVRTMKESLATVRRLSK